MVKFSSYTRFREIQLIVRFTSNLVTWLSFASVLIPEVLRSHAFSLLPKHFTGLLCHSGFFISCHVQSSGNTNTSLCLQFLYLLPGKHLTLFATAISNRKITLVTRHLAQTAIKVHKVPCFSCLCNTSNFNSTLEQRVTHPYAYNSYIYHQAKL